VSPTPSAGAGQPFLKMSGSGNDFVVIDARVPYDRALEREDAIRALCRRGTGVGADGLVLLKEEAGADFRMVYYNADGSRASMCGNAALCCTRLASRTGARAELEFETDSGRLRGRMTHGGPEIDLAPVTVVRPDAGMPRGHGEERIGFALAGVPHVTVLVDEVDGVDVVGRGRALRTAKALLPEGANANFVSRSESGWAIRTYERGVESETLACGTGAVASAILITAWGLGSGPVRLTTRSGSELQVRLQRSGDAWLPSLAGEGRIVFEGVLGEL
jgi:diaminopimelate epimerase